MQLNASTVQAILWSLGAAFVFTFVFAGAKFVGKAVDPIQVVFMRYLGAGIVIVFFVTVWRGGLVSIKSPRPSLHAARAACGVFGELCIISAPLFIAYEDATAVSLTSGVIAMLLAVVLLKERAGPLHWLASMICLAGAMLIARAEATEGVAGSPGFGISLAVFGAVLSGSELFFIKLLSDRERPVAIMTYVNILAVLMLLVPVMFVWKSVDGFSLLWLLAIGPLALLGQLCWIRAFQAGEAIVVVPIGYAAIPFAAVLGAVAFGEHLSTMDMTGGALVIIGGVLLARLGPGRAPEEQPGS